MKIEKLPSGSYRLRKTYKGKTYTVTTDYKPTQKEALRLMADELERIQTRKTRRSFEAAALDYMDIKKNVLSPSTLKGYAQILNQISDHFKAMRLSDIEQDDVQREINAFSPTHSPKTVRNYHGFISAVLALYRPDMVLKTTLPQKIKRDEDYIPTFDDVSRVIEALSGTEYEIAVTLAAFGLRRSEIIALELSDISDGVIHVRKAKVEDTAGDWQIKGNKAYDSKRDVPVPKEITDKIKAQGYIYKMHPEMILRHLHIAQDELGIPRFKLHALRHFFATELSQAHFSDEDIARLGGWSDVSAIMRKVYRHSRIQDDMESQRRAAEAIGNGILKKALD